jgi:hypothetical protein
LNKIGYSAREKTKREKEKRRKNHRKGVGKNFTGEVIRRFNALGIYLHMQAAGYFLYVNFG